MLEIFFPKTLKREREKMNLGWGSEMDDRDKECEKDGSQYVKKTSYNNIGRERGRQNH